MVTTSAVPDGYEYPSGYVATIQGKLDSGYITGMFTRWIVTGDNRLGSYDNPLTPYPNALSYDTSSRFSSGDIDDLLTGATTYSEIVPTVAPTAQYLDGTYYDSTIEGNKGLTDPTLATFCTTQTEDWDLFADKQLNTAIAFDANPPTVENVLDGTTYTSSDDGASAASDACIAEAVASYSGSSITTENAYIYSFAGGSFVSKAFNDPIVDVKDLVTGTFEVNAVAGNNDLTVIFSEEITGITAHEASTKVFRSVNGVSTEIFTPIASADSPRIMSSNADGSKAVGWAPDKTYAAVWEDGVGWTYIALPAGYQGGRGRKIYVHETTGDLIAEVVDTAISKYRLLRYDTVWNSVPLPATYTFPNDYDFNLVGISSDSVYILTSTQDTPFYTAAFISDFDGANADSLVGGSFSGTAQNVYAFCCSDDGNTIYGLETYSTGFTQAVSWNAARTVSKVSDYETSPVFKVYSCSSDGTLFNGTVYKPNWYTGGSSKLYNYRWNGSDYELGYFSTFGGAEDQVDLRTSSDGLKVLITGTSSTAWYGSIYDFTPKTSTLSWSVPVVIGSMEAGTPATPSPPYTEILAISGRSFTYKRRGALYYELRSTVSKEITYDDTGYALRTVTTSTPSYANTSGAWYDYQATGDQDILLWGGNTAFSCISESYDGFETDFPYTEGSVTIETTGTPVYNSYFYAAHDGDSYLQSTSVGTLSTLSVDVYTDVAAPIDFKVITSLLDGDSNKTKFWHSIEAIGDRDDYSLCVRWSDDDYTTWSAYRSLDMLRGRPIARQLGKSRRRAYELSSREDVPISLDSMESLVRIGTF